MISNSQLPRDRMGICWIVENKIIDVGMNLTYSSASGLLIIFIGMEFWFFKFQHVGLLEKMLQDFLLGEHLLLIGNQGVGKNKLTDKLLQLMNRPREYIQLHR